MKATIKDVAKTAGVSVATVSMALNNRPGTSEKTRHKVLSVAKQLSYVKNHTAVSLVTRATKTIGLLVPEIVNPYYSAIVDIISQLAEKSGYIMILGISNNNPKTEEKYVRGFVSRGVDGVIVVPMLYDKPEIKHLDILRKAKIPIVFCTETYNNCTEPCVMCDFEKGEEEIVDYVIKAGAKRICFVNANMEYNFTKQRLKGYKNALAKNGIEYDESSIFYLDSPTYESAYNQTGEILKNNPDAIVCINDMICMGIMKKLSEIGISIPKDIAIAGFDDMKFAELAQIPMTTVSQPVQDICEKTMNIIINMIENAADIYRNTNRQTIFYKEPKLVVRETTA